MKRAVAHSSMEKIMSSQPIQFFHRGELVRVSGVHPTRSVLDWLREDAHCSGTKEGCNEGDCGACTVVIAELADGAGTDVGGLNLRSVNACIQFLPTLHGKALFTVEDLKSDKPQTHTHALHPVQQAMVECHGSQCGFCTPGFVMTLWSTYQQHQSAGTTPSRQALADELSGNLCRCTGYRPILDAGERMFELPAAPLNTAPAVAVLTKLKTEATFSYQATNPQAAGRSDWFHAPQTLTALAALRLEKPKAQLLAGSTDVGLWVNKQFRDVGDIVYLGDVAELKRISVTNDELFIGAGATLEAGWRALAKQATSLTDVWMRFASPLIRNAGTMGGNVANGSPIGDAAPVLMAVDALIELRCGEVTRRMPLPDFYTGYMRNELAPGEFVQGMAVPVAALQKQVRAYKISKRFDCDISAVCAGFAIALEGDTVTHIRLAFGGMAATVKRALATEAAILGRAWDQQAVQAAKAAMLQDFEPLSDMRASAAYRMQVAQNLLQRFWLETRKAQPLAPSETSVWNDMAVARQADEVMP
jgi:xanthine dehydrogenase small subunit